MVARGRGRLLRVPPRFVNTIGAEFSPFEHVRPELDGAVVLDRADDPDAAVKRRDAAGRRRCYRRRHEEARLAGISPSGSGNPSTAATLSDTAWATAGAPHATSAANPIIAPSHRMAA
jgi:hypothetical protein